MSTDDFERLQIPNGISLDDDSMMEIEIAFDGETVTYRDEAGVLQDMGTLCYLDHILRLFIGKLTDEDGNDSHPEGITPGHVLCHLIQHLHGQYHQVETQNKLGAFAKLFAGEDGANPFTELGGSAVLVGPDGVQHINLSDLPTDDAEAHPELPPILPENESESDEGGEDDEGEIIVHGLPNDPQKL
jgi:hypothetical protein